MRKKATWQNQPSYHGMLIRRALIALLALVVGFAALYFAIGRYNSHRYGPEIRGNLDTRYSTAPSLHYDGVDYYKKQNLLTILFMGIDQGITPAGTSANFRNGGQADFLLLMTIDPKAKTISQLQIDRDTMAEITVLGVLGNEVGTRQAQISLSHGFGDGREQSSLFTVDAVRRLMQGIDIDFYMSLSMDAIPVLNAAVGGVSVTIQDDFSRYDDTMTPGETITLNGHQAELFVRMRYEIGDGSNATRMRRHREYISSLVDILDTRIAQSADVVGTLYDFLQDYITTDMRRGRMINEAFKANGYTRSEVMTLPGSYSLGADGFVEFNADTQAIEHYVLNTYYQSAS